MNGQGGFWDIEDRYVLLGKAGDPLDVLMKWCLGRFQEPSGQGTEAI